MLLQRHRSRVCHKTFKSHSQAQRIFKTAPLYAVTNPEESAPQDIWTTFSTFFESLWSPSTNPDGSTVQKAGMSYVYDEDDTLIAQTIVGGATTTWGQSAKYIYLPTASGPMPVAAIYGTKHYAIQSDHLNTPRRLIQSDGQVAWQWAYSAFGEEKPTIAKNRFANTDLNQSFGTSTVAAVTFNLRYPGQYFDQESGLHYNLNRSYSSTLGRYTQSDPIDLQGGWNRFSYVGQNPMSFTDPEGLQVPTPIGPIPFPIIPSPARPSPKPIDPYDPGGPTFTPPSPGFSLPNWMNSRANGEPKLPIVNLGKDCNGNCNPCPPGKKWKVMKPGHGWPNWYEHIINYDQDLQSCICYPDRPSKGLVGG